MEILVGLGFVGIVAFFGFRKFMKVSKGKIAVNNFFWLKFSL
jgi:hypothetical protein